MSPLDLIMNMVRMAGSSWFLWLPVLSLFLFSEVWHSYIRSLYKREVTWTFLEVKIPREIRRGPKAMEQVFSSLHAFITGPSVFIDRYWKGELKLWYSFEIASFGGDIHFYIKTPTKHKNYLEASIYAQYPDVEIEEVEDYTERMPHTYEALRNTGYEIWGTELALAKDDAYPIRLYEEFDSPSEYSQLDPIAALVEVLNTLRPGEELWIQILLSPADDDWQERGRTFVKKLQEKTRIVTESGDGKKVTVDRTPGEELALKAIERNIAKPGFETRIRYVYAAPDGMYDKNTAWYGVLGAFNQYRSKAHNSFKHDSTARTAVYWYYWPYFFPNWRLTYRRKQVYHAFKDRYLPESTFFTELMTQFTLSPSLYVLNTEELATIYHYPSNLVLTAPSIQRVESRKVGPPAQLPVFFDPNELPEGFLKK